MSDEPGPATTNIPDDVETPDELDPESHDSAVEEAAKRTPRGIPLRVDGLRKEFGGITAVDGASFQVEAGSLTGLIGPNGAGKSTTFNCITGVHTPTAGQVQFNGENITGLEPHEVANRGLVRTFQIARELEEMTVLENMMLAPKHQRGESVVRSVTPGLRRDVVSQEEELREEVWEMLEFFELDHIAEVEAGTLSGGQRKLLEMARALMTDPEMVLLDEPLAGVNPTLEEKLLERIHELREDGYTFLFVEHDMDIIMEHCEHIIVMHQGKVLAEGGADDIRNNEAVVEAYLGEDVS
ncbi:ATP-binding cassette domain-containing protein [Halosegnis rubeus]|jgi:branched-chain amino acid transport system ATP-binding protein|uniref:Probable branched-chain amino acid transport ATP-binding protein LivG n=1 Tax=Halosegnis rubeus TaxID=2212850 RepID=A0A5N5UJ97_9EURY|nr:ABC transporter ATP-binding protein [Halosegnis rubeus]KAB7513909.1 ATP-binding cassette domain-containing protein [Halosegnis rubeus]KAB7514311.1 ATP-binding cassette domain-containing protein [Halosegnis rubeus]KAB7518839.1 ATP-binding cassette domain-containing protein [Halosegnis rubeus]